MMDGNPVAMPDYSYVKPALTETAEIRMISCRKGFFLALYILLCFLFSFLIISVSIAAAAAIILIAIKKAVLADAVVYMKDILSFHFSRLPKNADRVTTGNIMIAWIILSILAGVVIIVILPEQNRIPPARRDGFKWWLAMISLFSVLVIGRILAVAYENSSVKEPGGNKCDVGGKIHYYTTVYSYGYPERIVYDIYNSSQLRHTYCLLHNSIFAVLHPLLYIRSMADELAAKGLDNLIVDPMEGFFILFLPVYIWFFVLLIIILQARPKVLRFHML